MNALLVRLRSYLLNLSLRTTIAGALLIAMAVPFGVSAWITLSERRVTLLERLHEDHARIVEVLAFGMQAPLWEIRPDTGKPMIEAPMLDPRITSITVYVPVSNPRRPLDSRPTAAQMDVSVSARPVVYRSRDHERTACALAAHPEPRRSQVSAHRSKRSKTWVKSGSAFLSPMLLMRVWCGALR